MAEDVTKEAVLRLKLNADAFLTDLRKVFNKVREGAKFPVTPVAGGGVAGGGISGTATTAAAAGAVGGAAAGRASTKWHKDHMRMSDALARHTSMLRAKDISEDRHKFDMRLNKEFSYYKQVKLWQNEMARYKGKTSREEIGRLKELQRMEIGFRSSAERMYKKYRIPFVARLKEPFAAGYRKMATEAFMPGGSFKSKLAVTGIEIGKSILGGLTSVLKVGFIVAIQGAVAAMASTVSTGLGASLVIAKLGHSVLKATDDFVQMRIVLSSLYGKKEGAKVWDEMFKKSMKYQATLQEIISATIKAKRTGAPYGMDIRTSSLRYSRGRGLRLGQFESGIPTKAKGGMSLVDLTAMLHAMEPKKGFDMAAKALYSVIFAGLWDRMRRGYYVTPETVAKSTGTNVSKLYRGGGTPQARLDIIAKYFETLNKGGDLLSEMSKTLTTAWTNVGGAMKNLLYTLGKVGVYQRIADFFNEIKDSLVDLSKSETIKSFGEAIDKWLSAPINELRVIAKDFFNEISSGRGNIYNAFEKAIFGGPSTNVKAGPRVPFLKIWRDGTLIHNLVYGAQKEELPPNKGLFGFFENRMTKALDVVETMVSTPEFGKFLEKFADSIVKIMEASIPKLSAIWTSIFKQAIEAMAGDKAKRLKDIFTNSLVEVFGKGELIQAIGKAFYGGMKLALNLIIGDWYELLGGNVALPAKGGKTLPGLPTTGLPLIPQIKANIASLKANIASLLNLPQEILSKNNLATVKNNLLSLFGITPQKAPPMTGGNFALPAKGGKTFSHLPQIKANKNNLLPLFGITPQKAPQTGEEWKKFIEDADKAGRTITIAGLGKIDPGNGPTGRNARNPAYNQIMSWANLEMEKTKREGARGGTSGTISPQEDIAAADAAGAASIRELVDAVVGLKEVIQNSSQTEKEFGGILTDAMKTGKYTNVIEAIDALAAGQ